MALTLRKEIECTGGKTLAVHDFWDGKKEEVSFQLTGKRGGIQSIFGLSREDAADLGRALVSLYGED